jgi:flagellar biosynthesis component FlhA
VELRHRLAEEMGIRVPRIATVPAPDLDGRIVQVRVYFRCVGTAALSADRATWVPAVLDELAERLRDYLYRLVGPDDVALWLKGWEPGAGDAADWDPPDPRADRLLLARVLRMLLREGVSVRDRGTIVPAVRSLSRINGHKEWATLETLRAVRGRLGRSALGVRPGLVIAALPAEIEKRVADGLHDGRPVWDLPRQPAYAIVADLRAWLDDQPQRPAAVRVEDARIRPFVWRLLAAERPVVHVLSSEELS